MSPFFTLDTNKACTVFLLADILCNTNKTNKSKTLWSALRLTPSMTWGGREVQYQLKNILTEWLLSTIGLINNHN